MESRDLSGVIKGITRITVRQWRSTCKVFGRTVRLVTRGGENGKRGSGGTRVGGKQASVFLVKTSERFRG